MSELARPRGIVAALVSAAGGNLLAHRNMHVPVCELTDKSRFIAAAAQASPALNKQNYAATADD